jgi:hypothetical protein
MKISPKNCDSVWALVSAYGAGHNICTHIVGESIRRCVDNFIETPTSPEIKKITGIDTIKSYSEAQRKYSRGKTGATIEHIHTVKDRTIELMRMAKENPSITKEEVRSYLTNSYKAVYRHYKLESLVGIEAKIYLPKNN